MIFIVLLVIELHKFSKFIVAFFCVFYFISFTFSQNIDHNGGRFLKRVEYNKNFDSYNLSSKDNTEKLFFGNINAPVEFYFNPSSEINPCIPSGFRIIQDSLNGQYLMEIKWVSNYREASKEADIEARDERHLIEIPATMLDSLPRHVFNLILDYNSNAVRLRRYFNVLPTYFKVETLSLPISNQLAELLYENFVFIINDFKAKGVLPIILDGYSVTFRTVVEDEVWSLNIHMPKGDALFMSNRCRLIITDAINNQFDEEKYISMLNTFRNDR